ncbi:hypothetical protein DFJ63DRAFT_81822 [Scheffersomyces coipomensis]|uniref:uncharacterized protein n=1 Tax=Scheffersomyces coipomensis TaxID=1788519 RepID=UPI00315C7298
MWIVTRKGDSEDIINLEPDQDYILGRVENADFLFNNSSVSRQQLQLVVGSIDEDKINDTEYKTSLSIKVLSRAKSTINGTMYRLSKGETGPMVVDVTNEDKVELVLGSDTDNIITIEWVAFNVMTFIKTVVETEGKQSNNHHLDDLVQLRSIGIDLRITNDVYKATHYYSRGEPTNKSFKIAVSRGVPILNEKWLDTIRRNKNNVEKWFLHIDYEKYLPGGEYLLPNPERSSLLKGITVFILSKGNEKFSYFINSLQGNIIQLQLDTYYQNNKLNEELLIQDMKEKSPPNSKCVLMKFNGHGDAVLADQVNNSLEGIATKFNTSTASEDSIWTSTKVCSLDNLRLFEVESLKRPNEAIVSQSEPSLRKRRKYEKVSKTHFFDFGACTQSQSNNEILIASSQVVPESNDDVAESNNPIIEGSVAPIVEPIIEEPEEVIESPKEVEKSVDEGSNGSSVDINKSKKRSTEEELKPSKPNKIGKFMPKVSLVDAIKSAKEQANELIKQELGIVDELEQDSFADNLSNLAIIETIEIKLRTKEPKEYNSTINKDYNGRKNFKTFKKNQQLKNKVTRSFVEMDTIPVNAEISFVSFKKSDYEAAEQRLTEDFGKVMQSVKNIDPVKNTLFIDDDDDDETGSFSFKPNNNNKEKSGSSANSLFVDEESQSTAQPVPNRTTTRSTTYRNYYDDDDDDDDDDDQPRFGFSRAN